MASTATIQPAWTLQSQNTAAVGRYHDGAFLQSLSTSANAIYRTGVIPTVATSGNGTAVDFIVTQAASPNMTVVADAGNAVVANSSGRGPYICANTANQTLTVATADPTNPRIDLVYIQVIDTVAGDTGSSTTVVGIVTGIPAASPTVPALPTNGVSIALAQVRVNANVTSITGSNITDIRKSAGIGRGPRWLLPGDALTDPGFCYGEERQRPLSSYPLNGVSSVVTDYWGYDSAWHGTLEEYPFVGTWNASGTSNITVTTTEKILYTVTIPDPGWAYYLKAYIGVEWDSASASGNSVVATVHLTNLAGAAWCAAVDSVANTGFGQVNGSRWLKTVPGSGSPVIQRWTGSNTFVLGGVVLGSGTLDATNPNTFGASEFVLSVIPA